jgi:hypothetical protein
VTGNRTQPTGLRRGLAAIAAVTAAAGCTTVAPPQGTVTPPREGEGVITVYAVGDVAQCGHGPVEATAAARTARLVPDGATVLLLGDAAYPHSDAATLQRCYEPTWGRHRTATLAVAGNHDYIGGSDGAFREYFGVRSAGGEEFVAYRRDLGPGWQLIVLDSNVGPAALQQQYAWLERELSQLRAPARPPADAANAASAPTSTDPTQCLLVAWHAPLFSSGLHRGSGTAMRPYWALLDRYGADAVLSGHEHFYEAFEPRDADGKEQAEGHGPRAFVVGTGGARLYGFWRPPYASRARILEHGVLQLSLAPGRYGWRFIDEQGRVRDAGAADCRALPREVR